MEGILWELSVVLSLITKGALGYRSLYQKTWASYHTLENYFIQSLADKQRGKLANPLYQLNTKPNLENSVEIKYLVPFVI